MGDQAEHSAAAELFNSAFEQDAMGMALRAVDPHNSHWLRVNQKFCDMLGYTREELLQLTSVEVSVPDERHLAFKYNEQLLRGDLSSYSREKRYLRKDGTEIWTQIWLSAVLDPDGNPTQIISVIQDISERKEAEEALRVSEQNYRTLFENIAAGIGRSRITDSKVFLANHKLAQIFGYERVWLQANTDNNTHTVEVLRDSYRRVMLMAQIHESFHRQGDLNVINARDLLNTLVTDTKKSIGGLSEHLSFHVDVDEIPLDLDHANAYGQIISELLANSLKHAFANGQPGNVEVSLRGGDGGRIELTVADDGKGLPEDFDLQQTKTLGLQLVRLLAAKLRGETHIDGSGGTRVQIDFPEAQP